MSKKPPIEVVPQGEHKKGIWYPSNPSPKGMSKLEKYNQACYLSKKIEEQTEAYTKAREAFRSAAQQRAILLAKQQEYLR